MTKWAKTVLILSVLLAVAFLAFRGRDYTPMVGSFDEAVTVLLGDKGIGEDVLQYHKSSVFRKGRHLFASEEKCYRTESDIGYERLLTELRELGRNHGLALQRTYRKRSSGVSEFYIDFYYNGACVYMLKLLKSTRPGRPDAKVALEGKAKGLIGIVLDDFGYNFNNVETLFSIGEPVTLSILPNLPYSGRIARAAARRNFEVILHLPLEPKEEASLEDGTLTTDMSEEEIRTSVSGYIEGLPGIKGVSNHMGSRATEDCDFMKVLLSEFETRGLYFLDNLVTRKSVCSKVAEEMGIDIATRSVFLDNELDEGYIERQIMKAAKQAQDRGWAIGVGHDRPSTVKVLARLMPELSVAGYKFVFVSELLSRKK